MKIIQLFFKTYVYLFFLAGTQLAFSQNVGISSSSSFTPDASAALDVSYTNKGLLIPRVALTASNAAGPIASPATSLLVYNTAAAGSSPNNVVPGYYYWNGVAWTMLSTSAQAASSWSTSGNAGTSYPANYLGTNDNFGLHVKTNAVHRFWIDTLGSVAIGTNPIFSSNREKLLVDAGITSSYNVISGKGNLNSYLQLNIQNNNAGTAASSDVVATADNGNESNYYVDMGINSSANTANLFGGANDSYLYSAGGASSSAAGGNLYIGTNTAGKSLGFLTGGSTIGTQPSGSTPAAANNERLHVDGTTGYIGINNPSPTQQLDVKGTIVASATTYPNYAYNTVNRMAFGEPNVPVNETGSVVLFGSGNTSRNMLLAVSKSGINSSFIGNDGSQTMIGSEGTANPITFRTGLDYSNAGIMATGSEWMRLTAAGNVGIGTTTPATKLHVFGANPLTLSGVVMGTNTTADSLLTITSGLVRKLPLSSFAPTGSWSTTGNSGTTAGANFIGTTDAVDFVFRTNNVERARLSSAGSLGIGTSAFDATNPERLLIDAGSITNTAVDINGTINDFFQFNIQNASNGTAASTDIVATANNGTNNGAYIDMGINSQGYTSTSSNILNKPNTAYLYSNASDFYIGNGAQNKALILFTNSGTSGTSSANGTEKMRIDQNGNVGIGTAAPTQKLDVTGTIRATTSVISQGSVLVDAAVANTGSALLPGLQLGGVTSGEGITSKRSSGTNQYGIDFYTNGNLQMTVANSGNVGIGTISPANKLSVAGVVAPSADNSYTLGTSALRWTTVYAANGNVQTSDRRLKTNIKTLNYGLKEVLSLQPISYNWKDKAQPQNKIGLIAQDVKKVIPEVVTGNEAKETLGMNYAELVPVLINAIKQQQQMLIHQQKQIDELKETLRK